MARKATGNATASTTTHNEARAVYAAWHAMLAEHDGKVPESTYTNLYDFAETHETVDLLRVMPLVAKALAGHRWAAAERRMDAVDARLFREYDKAHPVEVQ